MKRKLFILAVLAICLASLAGGTLAFYTSEGRAHNVITTGKVEIEVKEYADLECKNQFKNLTGIMPKSQITKVAKVYNHGAPAWVRVEVTKAIELAREGESNVELIQLDLNTAYWEDGGDGYYYYKDIVPTKSFTEPIFTTVTFDEEMDNLYKNATITVDVAAQAVQSANNGTAARNAQGWPAKSGE